MALKRLLEFGEHLCPPHPESGKDIEHWRRFVREFFAETGMMKYALWNSHSQWTFAMNPQYKDTHKVFELNTALLPRFYQVNFQSGVTQIQLIMTNPRELVVNNALAVECSRASLLYQYENGLQVLCHGHLRVQFTSNIKIELFEFRTKRHTELLPRDVMMKVEVGTPPANNANSDDVKSESGKDGNGVGGGGGGGGPGGARRTPVKGLPPDLAEPSVNEFGITVWTMRCLEIAEVVCHMRDLIDYSLGKEKGPIESLKMYSAAVRGRVEMRMPQRTPIESHPGSMPPPSSAPHHQPPPPNRMPTMDGSPMRLMPPTPQPLPPHMTNGSNGIGGGIMNGGMGSPSDGQGPGFDVLPTGKRPAPIDTTRPPPNNKKSKAAPSPRKTSQPKIPPNPHFTRSRQASQASASADA
ncbi:hypothetical protein HK097_003808 [Rhizophlyctis rosea]|uniref:Uncharacterized protein n=1 Tax=Rhizophlyctis rosea TaxID=64517 RepID=A0AAD5S3A8_9FUNG|nr:hypothetical protein HK097_003808 [Rhizophlyctis rosea]